MKKKKKYTNILSKAVEFWCLPSHVICRLVLLFQKKQFCRLDRELSFKFWEPTTSSDLIEMLSACYSQEDILS